MAFEHCIKRKPMLSVSLHNIAAKTGMSHAKLLNYFLKANNLILGLCALHAQIYRVQP